MHCLIAVRYVLCPDNCPTPYLVEYMQGCSILKVCMGRHLTISMEYGRSSGRTVMELGMFTTCTTAIKQWEQALASRPSQWTHPRHRHLQRTQGTHSAAKRVRQCKPFKQAASKH